MTEIRPPDSASLTGQRIYRYWPEMPLARSRVKYSDQPDESGMLEKPVGSLDAVGVVTHVAKQPDLQRRRKQCVQEPWRSEE